MTKNNSIDTNYTRSNLKALLRYHYFFFIVIVLGGLIYCFVSIDGILNIPTDGAFKNTEKTKMIDKDFDRKTIQKLDSLNFSDENDTITLPEGRINPFL